MQLIDFYYKKDKKIKKSRKYKIKNLKNQEI